MAWLFLFAILMITAETAVVSRFPALLRNFRYQSFCLALLTALAAYREGSLELYLIAFLLFSLKVLLIPHLFDVLIKRIGSSDHLGLFLNTQVSFFLVVLLGLISWSFARSVIPAPAYLAQATLGVACFVMLTGIFLMVTRIKALSQVIGLLLTENGVFLAATVIPGGMPFFVEIALFFDILVSVMILGLFIYRINAIFTHIDVSKLSGLKG
jgi:hydrogenase-4 component E